MARFSAARFEEAADFLSDRGIDFDPADLATDMHDLTGAELDEFMDIIESGDYEAFQDFCIEHGIRYHG